MRYITLFAMLCCFTIEAQNQNDELDIALNDTIKKLDGVTIFTKTPTPERLKDIEDNAIFSGKKNEVIRLDNINANLTTNNSRQVFSRIPGVSVWENDGSGIQINVAVRGLSPNRSWELNTRQNGYDISSDVFGYPEAYYNPPLEAVDKIQLVRGGASLQFGSQFGGMLNYVLKRETEKKFSFETQNTLGSYGMFSSYNAIGGNTEKFSYYVYNQSRKAEGWRDNGQYDVRNTHAFFQYKFSKDTKLSVEYTNMDYKMQQSGGLTDAQFAENPQQSGRQRNWFGTPWNVGALIFDTKFSDKLTFNAKLFGLIGERNSVGFVQPATTPDVVNPNTGDFANRQVDRDLYKNFGLETRSIYTYKLGNQEHNLAFGTRFYRANTVRKQRGQGTTGFDFDLNTSARYPRELDFFTDNISLFAENQFKVTDKLSITPGLRYEYINSTIEGRFNIDNNNNNILAPENAINRNVILAGLGIEYKVTPATNIYTNFSQAFRPVLFSDITPPATTDVIDENLQDASGFNFDFGYRGSLFGYINFDVNYFYMNYSDRIGTISRFNDIANPALGTFLFRTNLGESIHQGFEGFLDVNITKALDIDKKIGDISFFTTMSFIDAVYTDFPLASAAGTGSDTVINTSNLKDKRVENAPKYIHNFGLTWGYKNYSLTAQKRMVSDVFTDAQNTITPSANGNTGRIEGYSVYDVSMEYRFLEKYNLRAGVNNLTDEAYATRRAGGYPGPGLLPGEGRTFYISIGAKLF